MDETTDSAPMCPAQMPFSGQRTDSTQDGSGDSQPRHGSTVHVRAELEQRERAAGLHISFVQ